MIARLSDLLRMSLQSDGQHLTSLKRELEFTQAYLDIEKIRFGQRLSVNFEIAPETLDITLPHLLLQPLVENSIKHGIARSTTGGEITVAATLSGDKLSLSIKDRVADGADVFSSRAPSIGIGLKGTRERLRTFYGDQQTFEARALAGGAFEVQILLPIRDEDRLMLYGSGVEGVVAAVGGS
jgi:LytS/YehU family sensor histidine kinase